MVFDAEKRLRQFLWELPQFLLLPVAVDIPLSIDCPSGCNTATKMSFPHLHGDAENPVRKTGANPVRDRRRIVNPQNLPGAATAAGHGDSQAGKGEPRSLFNHAARSGTGILLSKGDRKSVV